MNRAVTKWRGEAYTHRLCKGALMELITLFASFVRASASDFMLFVIDTVFPL